ncbi:alpha-amylase family glycosyl hydrolase [Cohnella hashimotonis]|uniref:Alpha-amylase family glycosyl hydrolase n=1 Tax=Cohnella hashimotonis TaxID=2826895 RepID=A0ABT6TNQ5_9BACL|nr:alpha-amylase family glycosyl hydrolase [Cohnella hashimotonis]MDI4648181.1 alpha-amylase family glycosyl hydrolase [Cohnella hashimotonis]
MRRRRSGARRPLALALSVCMAGTVWLAGCEGADAPGGDASGEALPAGSSVSVPASASASASLTPSASASGAGAVTLGEANAPAMGPSAGVFYEIFVRSFSDSDGDGIGDLQGVTDKLDYLQQLGIKGIWLMPITPSPSYHGYDVTDYYAINPDYGTVDDLKTLLAEAHDRGIQVIMDLVLNHTSSRHPWFADSAGGERSVKRDWYKWASDGADVSALGPWGQAVWHHGPSGSSYLGVFSDRMPDLNLDSPDVREELIRIGQYWLGLGLDGYRLDAAKHVYEDFQSSSADPATSRKNVAWWQQFRQGISENGREPYLVGEVWDTTAVVGPFLDKALDSALNFEAAKLVLDAVKTGDASSLDSVLARQLAYYSKVSGGRFVDAPFLGNHDQNRVMSELGGDVERAKLAAALLLTLPGNPFLYYGEEIGMKGAKPDERIREPMLWKKDGKSDDQTSWELATQNDDTPSVEEQLDDPDSLLSRYKLLIGWRNEEPALGDGGFAPFDIEESGLLAFARVSASAALLVVHNLTGEARTVDLNVGGASSVSGVRFATDSESTAFADGKLRLPPYGTAILQ